MKYFIVLLLPVLLLAQAEIYQPKDDYVLNPTISDSEYPFGADAFQWGGGFGTNYYLEFYYDTTSTAFATKTLATQFSWTDEAKTIEWKEGYVYWRVQEDASGWTYFERFYCNVTLRTNRATIIKLQKQ